MSLSNPLLTNVPPMPSRLSAWLESDDANARAFGGYLGAVAYHLAQTRAECGYIEPGDSAESFHAGPVPPDGYPLANENPCAYERHMADGLARFYASVEEAS